VVAKLISDQEKLRFLLRKLRKDSGLSQKQLAEKLRKPQSFVSKYESGERRLDILELRCICNTLNLNLVTFVELFEKAITADESTSKLS
jgi:transcriptional regulator with XRE-family HTH domain